MHSNTGRQLNGALVTVEDILQHDFSYATRASAYSHRILRLCSPSQEISSITKSLGLAIKALVSVHRCVRALLRDFSPVVNMTCQYNSGRLET